MLRTSIVLASGGRNTLSPLFWKKEGILSHGRKLRESLLIAEVFSRAE